MPIHTNIQIQAYLTAAAINLKRLATFIIGWLLAISPRATTDLATGLIAAPRLNLSRPATRLA